MLKLCRHCWEGDYSIWDSLLLGAVNFCISHFELAGGAVGSFLHLCVFIPLIKKACCLKTSVAEDKITHHILSSLIILLILRF